MLNAERVSSLLSEWGLTEKEFDMLEEEFRVDDHGYWEKDGQKRPPDQQMQQKWKDIDEKMETDLETFSKDASGEKRQFFWANCAWRTESAVITESF